MKYIFFLIYSEQTAVKLKLQIKIIINVILFIGKLNQQ